MNLGNNTAPRSASLFNEDSFTGFIDSEFALPFLQEPVNEFLSLNFGPLAHSLPLQTESPLYEGDVAEGRSPTVLPSRPVLQAGPSSLPLVEDIHANYSLTNQQHARSHQLVDSHQHVSGQQHVGVTHRTDGIQHLGAQQHLDAPQNTKSHQNLNLTSDGINARDLGECYTPQSPSLPVSFPDLPAVPSSAVTQQSTLSNCNIPLVYPQPTYSTALPVAQDDVSLPPTVRRTAGHLQALPAHFTIAEYFGQRLRKDEVEEASGAELHVYSPDRPPLLVKSRARVPAAPKASFEQIAAGSGALSTDFSLDEFCAPDSLAVVPPIRKAKTKQTKKNGRSLQRLADHFPETLGIELTAFQAPTASGGTRAPKGKIPKIAKVRKEKVVPPLLFSKHCHVCARSGQSFNLAGCKNLDSKGCRKVVCRKCFATLEGYGTWREVTTPGDRWECIHCQDKCPERAQCKIYAKTNARRRDINLQKKKLSANKFICKRTVGPAGSVSKHIAGGTGSTTKHFAGSAGKQVAISLKQHLAANAGQHVAASALHHTAGSLSKQVQ